MQPRNVTMYIEKIDVIAADFLNRIRYLAKQHPDNRMPEEFGNELNKWSLESIGYIAFEERLGCLENDLDPNSTTQKLIYHVREMFNLMFDLETKPPIWQYVRTPQFQKFVDGLDFLTL